MGARAELHGEDPEAPHTPAGASSASKKSPAGVCQAPLSEVAGRQEKVERHVVEDLGELAPLVQILDFPAPQMVDNVLDALRPVSPMAVQALEVPKISCSPCPSRSPIPEPQSAEQLVEVPTVLSPLRNAEQIAEQIVDTPVPSGRGKRRVQGFLPEQSSTATPSVERISERTVEQNVDTSPGVGLGQGASSSAGPADGCYWGFSHFSSWEKVRSAGQVVSAKLGGHVSSSTLSAHQMARAGEPADSGSSDVWVRMHDGDTDQSYFWNRRTRESANVVCGSAVFSLVFPLTRWRAEQVRFETRLWTFL